MSFISTQALIATMGQQLLVAGMPSCSDADNPTNCLSVNDPDGNPTCTWLMLSGSCADAASSETMSSPVTCCSSQAAGSPCQHQSAELLDGLCSVPDQSGQNGMGPSLEEMQHWLHLAFAVYCPESEVKDWNCGVHCDAVTGLSMVRYMSTPGYTANVAHAAMVAYDSQTEEIVLSFKGTDNDAAFIENWVTNLDFFKKNPIELQQYPEASVHAGFWDSWLGLKPDVMAAIAEITASHSGVKAIRVTGHSLGAAIATNAAMDLKLNHGFVTSVVNFGSPRPGDLDYHKAILSEVPHWRVTHNNDLVPHVAPQSFGFWHASTEIHFPETGLEFKVCDGSGEDKTCANACYPLHCTSVDDHLHYLGQPIVCGSSSGVVV